MDKTNLTSGYLVILLFLTFATIFVILVSSEPQIPQYAMILAISCLGIGYVEILYKMLIKSPRTRKYATKKLDQFIKEVNLDQNLNRKISDRDDDVQKKYKDLLVEKGSFYCAQCGSKLTKKMKFCRNCGDTTKDELLTIQKR